MEYTRIGGKSLVTSSNRERPIARITKQRDANGWHEWDEIDYYCPKCKKLLRGYAAEVGCADCGIFFNWGKRRPEIETTKLIVW